MYIGGMGEQDHDDERENNPASDSQNFRATHGEQVINTLFDWEARKLAFDILNNVGFTECRVCHVDKQVTVEGPRAVDPGELREWADRLGIQHVELDGEPIVWEQ